MSGVGLFTEDQAIEFPTPAALLPKWREDLREIARRPIVLLPMRDRNTEPGICMVCERPFQPAANNWKKQLICGDRECRMEYSRRYQRNRRHNVIELPNRGGVMLTGDQIPLSPPLGKGEVTHPVGCAATPLDRGDQHPPISPLVKGDLKHYLADRNVAVMVVDILAVAELYSIDELMRILNLGADEIEKQAVDCRL